jgi:hypothetical protein
VISDLRFGRESKRGRTRKSQVVNRKCAMRTSAQEGRKLNG